MSRIEKTGVVSASEFIEPDGVDNQFTGNATSSYTPSTGTNSCMNMGKWMVPEGAVAGDTFFIRLTVQYSGFDRSNTGGTFRLLFQGSNYTSPTAAAWQGNNLVCSALNSKKNLTDVVLTGTSGTFTYETTFTLNQTFLDTYYGSNIGTRSDYSNGVGVLTIKDITIIPEEYSTTSTPPLYENVFGRNVHLCGGIHRNLNSFSRREVS